MSDIRYQVFVSSTYKDLKDIRRNVIDAIMSINAIPAGMELFPSADEDAWTIIRQSIDLSDYYVVIIGGKYGSVDPSTGLSYTEMEYDYAASKAIPIMAFIHENPEELKAKDVETGSIASAKLDAFKEKAKRKHCKFWKDETDLIQNVLVSYTQMTTRKPGVGWIRGNEAKTKEDVEYLAKLERKIRELEGELQENRQEARELEDIYSDLQAEHTISLLKPHEQGRIDLKYNPNDLLLKLSRILYGEVTEYDLNPKIIEHIEELYFEGKKMDTYWGGDYSFTITNEVKYLFSIRQLIEDRYVDNQQVYKAWYMTNLGKKYIAFLERKNSYD